VISAVKTRSAITRSCHTAVCDDHSVAAAHGGVGIEMATVNGDDGGDSPPPRLPWDVFCEQHASVAAQDFVRSFLLYQRTSTATDPRDPADYTRKYVECFQRQFSLEVRRSSFVYDHSTEVKLSVPVHNLSLQENGEADYADQELHLEEGTSPSKKTHKSLLRRLSFKNIRKGRLFKHSPPDDDCSESGHRKHRHKHDKSKHGKSSNKSDSGQTELKKEGVVHVLSGEDSKGRSKWEKTRLVLIKTTGGYLVEFYCPPKVGTDPHSCNRLHCLPLLTAFHGIWHCLHFPDCVVTNRVNYGVTQRLEMPLYFRTVW